MDVPPDLYYLADDFNPNNLKVAELRGILLKHDAPYSPAAKKPELVAAFEQNVAAKSDEILKIHRQLKPNGKGILQDKKPKASGRSSSRKITAGTEDRTDEEAGSSLGEELSSAKSRRDKRAVKETQKDQEGFAIPAQPTKPKASALRKKSKNTWTVGSGLTSESEVDAKPSPTRTSSIQRKKDKVPQTLDKATSDKKPAEPPSFSDTNPFQSGAESDVSVTRKSRKAAAIPLRNEETKKRQSAAQPLEPSSSTKSVKSENAQDKAKTTTVKAAPSTRRSRAAPDQGKFFNPQDSFASSGGEEEPVAEHKKAKSSLKTKSMPTTSKAGSSTQTSTSSDSARRPSYSVIINKHMKNPLEQALTIGLSLLIGLYCIFWCLERHRIGYCDVSHDDNVNGTKETINLDLNEGITTIWDAIRPSCIPCPKHGHCTKGRLLGCDDFFVRIPSMLSFGGWIPVGEKCVPDTVKQRRAFRVENQIKHMLAVKKGKFVCGELKAEHGQSEEEAASMKVEDVWTELLSRKPETVSEQQLEEYWRLAMASLMTYSEKEVSFLDRGDDKFMVSHQPKLTLGCRIRLQIKGAIYRWRFELGGLAGIVGLIAYANYRLMQRRKDMKLVAELAGEAFVKLQEQERNHYIDPVLFPQACCAISHLRDLILAQEPSVERRQYLWNHVRKIVESNSNVRTLSAEVRGEPHRCWEWVGYGQSVERIPVGSGVEIHSGEMINSAS
ncbi:unnamed protein product [Umbelopsis sp. WA50703]